MVKAGGSEKSSLRKGKWTLEEDRKLIAYTKRYGIWNWKQMPKYAGLLRCGKSCRLRWMNYLRPDLKRGNFSKEEDEIIIKLQQKLGNRWSAIASKLPGRTDNEIKNHWHAKLKKRSNKNKQQKQNPPESLLLADPFLPINSSTSPQLSTDNSSSSTNRSDFADEFNKIHISEVCNYSTTETFDQLHDIWEQPFIMEDLSMMEDYGATYTDTDPGFMILTPLWGFEEDHIPPSVSGSII